MDNDKPEIYPGLEESMWIEHEFFNCAFQRELDNIAEKNHQAVQVNNTKNHFSLISILFIFAVSDVLAISIVYL